MTDQTNEQTVSQCMNCGAELFGKFCSECGQKKPSRLSSKEVLSQVYEGFFDFESPFIKTFVTLTTNPGKLYREYMDGTRQRYFSPVKYSFMMLSLMVFAAGFADVPLVDLSPAHKHSPALSDFIENIQVLVNTGVIPFTFINALLLAWITRLFFKREKYTATELFFPMLLNISHFSIVTTIAILAGFYQQGAHIAASLLLACTYFCWALAETYQRHSFVTYVKAVIAYLLGTVSLGFLMGLVTGIVSEILSIMNRA